MSKGHEVRLNPRLQRTPSASPPSPLSRKPLGAPSYTRRILSA